MLTGREKKEDRAIGRSHGGWTTKIHAAVDNKLRPIMFLLTGGNVHDSNMAIPLLRHIDIKGQYVNGDKGYDYKNITYYIEGQGGEPNIPSRCNAKK